MNCTNYSKDVMDFQIKCCKSAKDIRDKFPEFEINQSNLNIVCKICSQVEIGNQAEGLFDSYNTHLGVFSYEKYWEHIDLGNLPVKIKDLKYSIKRHLLSPEHKSSIGSTKQYEEIKRKLEVRNKKDFMRCMRICFLTLE